MEKRETEIENKKKKSKISPNNLKESVPEKRIKKKAIDQKYQTRSRSQTSKK